MAKVLVIDDDPTNRDLLYEILSINGHTVILAEDGEIGLKAYLDEPPDLIITDIMMPKKDGISLIKEIRQTSPSQKIIAIAAAGGMALEKAKDAGADLIIEKPFRLQFLLQQLQILLSVES